MQAHLRRLAGIVTLLAIFIGSIGPAGAARAALLETHQPAGPKPGIRVVSASFVGASEPLRSLAPMEVDSKAPSAARSLKDRLLIPKSQQALTASGRDESILQGGPLGGGAPIPAPETSFDGVGNVSGVLPPDTQGDIGYDPATGKKYYVQWVNLAFAIWDVTNPAAVTQLYGPAAGNTLWAGTGSMCASHNDGDPITQFDHLSNRWMMSQFALSFPNDFHQCIAVSASADPLGAWYLYDFQTSTTVMNDYPHFGVWPDGYYMTVNQFNGATFAWAGTGAAVFERSAMLNGLPARMIYFDVGAETLDYGGMLPADLDGPAPAVGTPNYFMEWDDSTWLGDAADTLRVWQFHTDWAVPANSTFGLNTDYDPNLMIATANVDSNMCGGARSCIPQPGTAAKLDAIADRLMYRLQFRDFGSYQVIVGNHTVDATGMDKAGIHWFELRDTGAGFGMYQQGVYAPDTDHRWMGSAAMDESGDIALGFSASSTATRPSVRYTGRLVADPLGSLPQGERDLVTGGGSQTHPASRWGDYSMLAVDSFDGCTFWYTQEYYAATSGVDWSTRIGSFRFPSCTATPTGSLSGTVTDGSAPIAGVTVGASGGYTTVTDAAGHYQLTLVAGSYDVTVSKYGYVGSSATGLVLTTGNTTTQNFTLSLAPSSTISGVVTDATTGWPLYARIEIFGYPSGPVFSDPLTGAYSINLVNSSYTFTVSALSGSYTPEIVPIAVSGNATRDFALDADALACTAPGYSLSPASFSEDFETWPLTGWTVVDNVVGLSWNANDNPAYHDDNYIGSAGLAATVNSDKNPGTPYDTELRTPLIDPIDLASLVLRYKANYQDFSPADTLDLDISNDGGMTWVNISNWTTDKGAEYTTPGVSAGLDLTPYVSAPFQLRWRYYSAEPEPWDWYAQIDDVKLGQNCLPIASGGLVVGTVKDANTGLPLASPSVKDAALNPALVIDNAADASQDSPMYIIAQAAGAQTLTASTLLSFYTTESASPTVVSGGTIRQDFHLRAGQLSTSPTSLSFNVTSSASQASKPLTLTNSGDAAAGYEVFAIPGTFQGYTPGGPFADHTRHFGPKNLNDRNASQIRVDLTPSGVTALAAGDVTTAWDTGLTFAWGIGFNTDATDLWLNNIAAAGGDNFNYRFLPDGTNTGDKIDTAPWVTGFGADMAYNPFTNRLWQINVGGDSCVYEMDLATLAATGNRMCPAFGTSQRGLAFDPLTNTYYSGSWNDGILNHFAPDGTMLDSKEIKLSISGLAFNPGTGHLFVMINNFHYPFGGPYDVYVLDTRDSYKILGAFNFKQAGVDAFGDFGQAGLEIDCSGQLWAVDQGKQKVYAADSGETGVCNWQAAWLGVTPATGSVGANGNASLTVNVNATGLSAGAHPAYLRVVSSTPYGDEIVPVTLDAKADLVKTFKSVALRDGWVLEAGENSSTGGSLNATASTLRLGDDASNRQYKGILSFNTAGLPNAALIESVQLRIRKSGAPIGSDPFSILGKLWIDIRQGSFGAVVLQLEDFNATASATKVGSFNTPPTVGWYSATLNAAGENKINKTGVTQFRLYFATGDNNNHVADYMKFLSGNAVNGKPELIITYTLP